MASKGFSPGEVAGGGRNGERMHQLVQGGCRCSIAFQVVDSKSFKLHLHFALNAMQSVFAAWQQWSLFIRHTYLPITVELTMQKVSVGVSAPPGCTYLHRQTS